MNSLNAQQDSDHNLHRGSDHRPLGLSTSPWLPTYARKCREHLFKAEAPGQRTHQDGLLALRPTGKFTHQDDLSALAVAEPNQGANAW